MVRKSLPGSRIRERRIALGMRQAALAQAAGISASYLNLIEHNRRRIGGRVLNRIAAELGVEPAQLGEGVDRALVERLLQVAAEHAALAAEPPEDLADAFPGWTDLVLRLSDRATAQRRQIAALTDRVAQDPQLAASVHDLLSQVTAVRSTAGILGAAGDLDREWLDRFHRNILEDSKRLADGARALVAYLDAADDEAAGGEAGRLPQEELEAWMGQHPERLKALESGIATAEALAAEVDDWAANSETAALAAEWLSRYRRDAEMLPAADLTALLDRSPQPDPLAIAAARGLDPSLVMRRIAAMQDQIESGLIICDSSGAIIFRKPVTGFTVPRYGAACPLWPLYQAMSQPLVPIRRVVEQAGFSPRRFLAIATAEPILPPSYGGPQVMRATMLLIPVAGDAPGAAPDPIGPGCRLCLRTDCRARREPSLMAPASAAAP